MTLNNNKQLFANIKSDPTKYVDYLNSLSKIKLINKENKIFLIYA
jgi:hypothetical protein